MRCSTNLILEGLNASGSSQVAQENDTTNIDSPSEELVENLPQLSFAPSLVAMKGLLNSDNDLDNTLV